MWSSGTNFANPPFGALWMGSFTRGLLSNNKDWRACRLPWNVMRERDLKALEFDKVMAIVMGLAASEPAREVLSRLRPSIDIETVKERLRASAEMSALRQHTGAIPI